ncbi:hypothetical protein AB0H28_28780 [Micromonospora sp. NPDC050980]|uniref:hypothetical protein n=1 Tax=Micromonospora sp. NPDC050980 TaxID=3155161 RepID=UPI0033C19434
MGNAPEHERLIAPFLHCPEDPMLSRMALIVLDEWGFFEKYRGSILQLLRGVDWDYDSDVRIIALTRAGKYIASKKDCTLLLSLIETAESDELDEVVRRAALDGLALAAGGTVEEWPPVVQRFDLSSPWQAGALRRARQRLSREC